MLTHTSMAPIALITGSSEGIGKATALFLARKGYDIVLAARHSDTLEAAAREVRSLGREVLPVVTDMRDPVQVNSLIEKALGHYGQIDVLVNNAGVYLSGPIESFSLEDWHQAIDLNLWGYIYTIQALLPHFLQRGTGTIVNVSSIGGKVAVPYLAPYCTTKFAVTGLTESLQSELSPKGIHVAGIYPNVIKSNFMQRAVFRGKDAQDQKARQEQLEQVLKVPVVEKPEDVAQAIWEAIAHQKAEVIVGSANLSVAASRLFPNLMQWVFRKTFQLKDQT
jgi:short-subunit dehydrogenase